MKKFLAAGLFTAALASAPALAADMPVKAPPMAAAPSFSWTGCYLGGNVGGGWKHVRDTDATNPSFFLMEHTFDGLVGGGQIGCDSQVNNNWVVGLRAMWDASGVKGTKVGIGNSPTDFIPLNVSQLATLTAKAGYLINPALQIYGAAGYGWLRESSVYHCPTCVPALVSSPARENRSGFDAGIGIDWMFQRNWDLFIEYDHMWLGKHQANYNFGGGFGSVEASSKQHFDKVVIGLNYRFGGDTWGKAPVTAKY